MNRLNRDTITAIVLLLVCGAFFWQTFYIRDIPFSTMGSEVWPRFALTLMFILVAVYLVQSIATPPAEGERRSPRAWLKSYSSAICCFGMFFLFLLALPCCIPFLYGVPQVVALPMLALALQMVIGREEPWLPAGLAARKIDRKGLTQMAQGGRKWFGWIEAIIRPRFSVITGRRSERVIGAFLFFFCCSILVPLPMTNTVPGMAVAVTAFGLMQKDGLAVTSGIILGTLWVGALITGAFLGLNIITQISGALLALGRVCRRRSRACSYPRLP